jgi:hypothetical protein
VNELALIAMLPDFQGYTLAAAQDLTGNAPDSRIVNLMLKSDQTLLPEQERLDRIYMSQVENPKGQLGPYGLRQYVFRADSGYHDQDLFVGTGTQGPMVILCTKLAADIPAQLATPARHAARRRTRPQLPLQARSPLTMADNRHEHPRAHGRLRAEDLTGARGREFGQIDFQDRHV